MTKQSDLAWQSLDEARRSSVAHQLARYAISMRYDMLPREVEHQAKRSLLDALGCAIGAYDAPGRPMLEETVRALGGSKEATVFGSGLNTSAPNASLINSFLVRFLDFNDIGGGCHNSDAIPALLAVSERESASGREFLTSIVISYELGSRVVEASTASSWEEKGINYDARGGLSMPPALGTISGMNEDQIANAIGICASHSLPLKILDGHKEELTMAKSIRFGWVAHDAVLSCMLASRGFTGPERVVEGDTGFRDSVLRGDMDLDKITDFAGWRILKTRHKMLCANGSTIGHVLATLAIVKEHDLKPEEIASVKLRTSRREAMHTTAPAKKYPRNAETASHSAFFANAAAIKDRYFGPESFRPKKFVDPTILELIEKISIEADAGLPKRGGTSIITTCDGRRYEKRVEQPHGFEDDPLSDKELEDKFRAMASQRMPEKQASEIIETVWNMEKVPRAERLAALMVFPQSNPGRRTG